MRVVHPARAAGRKIVLVAGGGFAALNAALLWVALWFAWLPAVLWVARTPPARGAEDRRALLVDYVARLSELVGAWSTNPARAEVVDRRPAARGPERGART